MRYLIYPTLIVNKRINVIRIDSEEFMVCTKICNVSQSEAIVMMLTEDIALIFSCIPLLKWPEYWYKKHGQA